MSITQLSVAPALIDQVHDRLLTAIVDGSLAPGERLTQESVADRLGVSRQPVSHALQVLKRRGLLIEAGKRGLMVAPLDATRIIALYQVREALDALAARLAAERVKAGLIGTVERRDLGHVVERGQAFTVDTAIAERIEADVSFHTGIHRMSGNSAIAETVAEQWPHFMRSMGMVLTEPGMRSRVWDEHAEILTAILAGEPAQAEQRARAHTSDSGIATARKLQQPVALSS